MGERCRPRDLYDVVNLYRRTEFRQHADIVLDVLKQKCESKGVNIPSAEDIRNSPMFGELRSEWENMLAHQLRALPEFDHFWSDIPHLFAWLNGAETYEELEYWPMADGEELWSPPQTFWTSGLGNRLDPVRFAAVNRLLVDLKYDGSNRLIEPYSLRRSKAGNILLYAIRADGRGTRAYRIDRIQSVEVTTHPFTPRFLIEIPEAGVIPTPPTLKRGVSRSSRPRLSRRTRFVVSCSVCGRRFQRVQRNTRLRPHKDPDSNSNCPGRSGYVENET